MEHVQRVALDMTVQELIMNGILSLLPAASCAICGQSMRVKEPPIGNVKPDPLPDLSPSTEAEEDAFIFVHAIKAPDISTWIHWHTMIPCGHQVHTMCL